MGVSTITGWARLTRAAGFAAPAGEVGAGAARMSAPPFRLRNARRQRSSLSAISSPTGLAALAAALLASTAAYPQAFNATPATINGSATYDRATPGVETITTNVSPAEIAWTLTPPIPGNPWLFLPVGNTATFQDPTGSTLDYTVVNRLVSQPGAVIRFDGTVYGRTDGNLGGTVIFDHISGGTMVIGSTAFFDVEDLVMAGDTIVEAGAQTSLGTSLTVLGNLNNAGTVQIGNGGTYGAVTGNILNNGVLTFNRSDAVTYAGIISGGGIIQKQGAGTLTLTGTNTYTGGTAISDGTLSVGADNNLGDAAGGLTFNGGTLNATSSFSSARAVTVGAGGAFFTQTASSVALTLTGLVSGAGAVTQNGPGGLVLNNAGNSYLGGTVVNNGFIVATEDGVLGDAAGGVTLNGNGSLLTFGNWATARAFTLNATSGGGGLINVAGAADSLTLNGLVTGTGALRKSGNGTLTLTGTNTYTGGTAIIAGTLRLGDAGNTGAILGGVAVAAGGTFEIVNADTSGIASITNDGTTTFRNDTSAGSAAITNNGSLFFETTSTAGIATITNNLDLAFFNTSTAGSATITNNALMYFSGASTAGSATITTGNGGATRFFDNSTGGGAQLMTDAGGVVDFSQSTGPANDRAPSAGSIAGAGDFFLGANTLTVGSNNLDTVVSGVISDCGATGNDCGAAGASGGALAKTGAGTLTLSGANTYTGGTTVNGGMLSVNGSIATSSLTTVNAGGTLGGTGTVGTTLVNSGGMLAPGNSIGTINVSGNLTMAAGSIYAVEVDAVSADRTDVTGTADLSGGTVAASYASATYVQKTYTIVSTQGGLGGTTFAGLTGTAPTGFTQKLAYDGSNAYLQIDLVMRPEPEPTPEPGPNPHDGISVNQRGVANAIVAYFDANGGIPAEFAALDPNGLTQVSGEPTAAAISAGIESADQFLGLISDQALAGRDAGNGGDGGASAYADDKQIGDKQFAALGMEAKHSADPVARAFESRWQGFGAAYGGSRSIDGDAVQGSHDTDVDTFGLAGGIARRWEGTLVGLALGGGSSSFDLSDGLGSGNARTFNAGIFARQELGKAYVSAAAAYGFHDVEIDRTVEGEALSGDFSANSFSGRVEAGYGIATPIATLTPYAAFQAIAYKLPGYTETGAGSFALAYEGGATTVTRTELGARIDRAILLDGGAALTLSGRAALAINGGDDIGFTAGFVSLPGTNFSISGATPDRYSALVDAGAEYRAQNGFFAAVALQGEFSGNVTSLAGKAKLGFEW